jgi:O-antigen/teichoic acid export membrane protein
MRLVPSALWLAVLLISIKLRVSDPARMTAAYLVLLACAGPLLTGIVWRAASGSGTPSIAAGRELTAFGLPSVIGTLPQFFNVKLDQMMVTAIVAPRQLGVYMAAAAWGSAIPMLSSAISLVMSSRIAAGSSDAERNRHFNHGVRGAAWVVAAAVIVLVAATPLGITAAFGGAFQAAIVPAAILVVASGANAINGVLEELLRGYGRPGATLRAESAALAVGLPALLLLLPRAGLTGAAIGSLIGSAAATVVLLFESRQAAALQIRDVFDTRAAASLLASLRQRFDDLRVARAVGRDF